MDPENLEREVKRLKLDLNYREKDDIDEIINAGENESSNFPTLLIHQLKEVLSLQATVTKAHIESVKSGNFKVYHNKELRETLLDAGLNIHVPDTKINNGIQRIDFTFPFLLNLPEVFNEFKEKGEKYLSDGVVCKSRNEDESVSVPLSNIFHTSASSTNPITVQMLKNNPEEHGLNKDVLDGFSDEPEIIDIQVMIRGRRKRVKAFKDGQNILIPCAEKNCSHTQLDFNDVAICANKTKIAKIQPQSDFDEPPALSTFSDFSLLHEVASGSTSSVGFQNMNNDSVSLPQIMSVKSLAPNFPSRLNPLASQLPNPNRKNTSMTVVSSLSQLMSHPNQTIYANTNTRPSILSKSGQTVSANGNVMPIIFVPTNSNNNKRKLNSSATLPSSAECTFINVAGSLRQFSQLPQQTHMITASQLQKSIQRVKPPIPIAPAPPPSIPMETEVTIYPLDSDNEDPDAPTIESIFSASTHQNQRKDNRGVQIIEKASNEKNTSQLTDTEKIPNAKNGNDENDSESTANPTPINFATNIFEEIEEQDNETEELEYNGFDVPQIVSTTGGVILPVSMPQNTLNKEENEIERAILKRLHKIRRKCVGQNVKGTFPDRKLIAGVQFNCCRFCGLTIKGTSLNLYKLHMETTHRSKSAVPTTDDKQTTGVIQKEKGNFPVPLPKPTPTQVPKPTTILAPKSTLMPITKSTLITVGKPTTEWYKCKKCDQIMQQKNTVDHLVTCCPNLGKDAFTLVQMGIGSGILESESTRPHPVFCGLCEKSYESLAGLRHHLNLNHKEICDKIILEPAMRCAFCLQKFVDSVHLTIHCNICENRKASAETMLELAEAMLHCDVCGKVHATISESQDCYTKTGHIRCLLCLYTVLSRGNFFHHMKAYHYRGNIGICCPFCDIGEISIRDCFIHILDSHYNPILMYKSSSSSGVMKDTYPIQIKDSIMRMLASNTSVPISRLFLPTSQPTIQPLPTQMLTAVTNSKPLSSQTITSNPGLIRFRTSNPTQVSKAMTLTNPAQTQTITIRAGQIISGAGISSVGQSIIRQVQIANSQAAIRPIQISSANQTTRRQVNSILLAPITTSSMTTPTQIIRPVTQTTSSGMPTPIQIIRQLTPITSSGVTTPTQIIRPVTQTTSSGIPMPIQIIRQLTPTTSSGVSTPIHIIRQVTPSTSGGLPKPIHIIRQVTPTTSFGVPTPIQIIRQVTPTTSAGVPTPVQIIRKVTPTTSAVVPTSMQIIRQVTPTTSSGATNANQNILPVTQTTSTGLTTPTQTTRQVGTTTSSGILKPTPKIQPVTTTLSGISKPTLNIQPVTTPSGMTKPTQNVLPVTTTPSGLPKPTPSIRPVTTTTSSGVWKSTPNIRTVTPTTSSGVWKSTPNIRTVNTSTSSGVSKPTPNLRPVTTTTSSGVWKLTPNIRTATTTTSSGVSKTTPNIRPVTSTPTGISKPTPNIRPVTTTPTGISKPTPSIRPITTTPTGISKPTPSIRPITTTPTGISKPTPSIRPITTTPTGISKPTQNIRPVTTTTSLGVSKPTPNIRPVTTNSSGVPKSTPNTRPVIATTSSGVSKSTESIRTATATTLAGMTTPSQINRPGTTTTSSGMTKPTQIIQPVIATTSSGMTKPTQNIRTLTPTTSSVMSKPTQNIRTVTPTTSTGMTTPTQFNRPVTTTTSSGMTTPTQILRPIRPLLRGSNATIRGGTFQAITPAQLQRSPIITAPGAASSSVRVNLSSLNLLKK